MEKPKIVLTQASPVQHEQRAEPPQTEAAQEPPTEVLGLVEGAEA